MLPRIRQYYIMMGIAKPYHLVSCKYNSNMVHWSIGEPLDEDV